MASNSHILLLHCLENSLYVLMAYSLVKYGKAVVLAMSDESRIQYLLQAATITSDGYTMIVHCMENRPYILAILIPVN
jgi:hypothetical protein